MPPEPKTKLRRRSSKRELESEYKFDGGHARELEVKRSRGVFFAISQVPSADRAVYFLQGK